MARAESCLRPGHPPVIREGSMTQIHADFSRRDPFVTGSGRN